MKLFTMSVIALAVTVLAGCIGAPITTDFPTCGSGEHISMQEIENSKVTEYITLKGGTVIPSGDKAITVPCTPEVPENCEGSECFPEVCTVDCVPEVCTTDCEEVCTVDCEEVEDVCIGNPGNGKCVGKSPWDGITGNSHKNDTVDESPDADTMDGQRLDTPFLQPGGKGWNASRANK